MQRNLILTDLMKTGHNDLYNAFINMNTIKDQHFDCCSEYYMLPGFDLDAYDRKFAMIDRSIVGQYHPSKSSEYRDDLQRRKDLLHSQGFKFILATAWESLENIQGMDLYPPHVDEMIWCAGVSWFWFYMWQKHRRKTFAFKHDDKKSKFLYLNKLNRKHRVKLFERLQSQGTLEKSIWTRWPEKKLPKEYELPWAQNYPTSGMDQDIYEKPYNDSWCSIVSETNDNATEIFMTEKIWKPIIAQQVFVVHGNYLYLQKLREMGFKTFSNYFDESYDLEKDSDHRIEKLTRTIKNLHEAPWEDIYLQTQSLRKHNADLFFNKEKLSLEINKTLESFLEFADGSQVTSRET